MPHIRHATPADSDLICQQRIRMFVDAGHGAEASQGPMIAAFRNWLMPRLADGTYIGWIIEEESRPVGGLGMWLMDYPPSFRDVAGTRAYLMNMYIDPSMRRRGLARQLVELAMQEARHRRIRVITLHATPEGRAVYEQLGFHSTREMMLEQEL